MTTQKKEQITDHATEKVTLINAHERRWGVYEGRISAVETMLKKTKPGFVLDVGCRAGLQDRLYRHIKKIVGFDVDLAALKKADTKTTVFHKVCGDGCRLCFRKNIFDAVISTEVIEHVKDPVAMLKEFNYVLKKNGYLMLTTPNRFRIANYLRKLIGKEYKIPYYIHSGPGGYHFREYIRQELSKDLESAGFKVIKFYPTYFGISFCDRLPLGTNSFASWFLKYNVSLAVLARKI